MALTLKILGSARFQWWCPVTSSTAMASSNFQSVFCFFRFHDDVRWYHQRRWLGGQVHIWWHFPRRGCVCVFVGGGWASTSLLTLSQTRLVGLVYSHMIYVMNLWTHIHTCTYTYTYTHTYTYTYTYTYTFTYINIYAELRVNARGAGYIDHGQQRARHKLISVRHPPRSVSYIFTDTHTYVYTYVCIIHTYVLGELIRT